MKKLLICAGFVIALGVGIVTGQRSNKLWIHSEGTNTDEQWSVSFYYLEDRETGTRCYAMRGPDSVAINCVKK